MPTKDKPMRRTKATSQYQYRIHKTNEAWLRAEADDRLTRHAIPPRSKSGVLAQVLTAANLLPERHIHAWMFDAPLYNGFNDLERYAGIGAMMTQWHRNRFTRLATTNLDQRQVARGYPKHFNDYGLNLMANQLCWAFAHHPQASSVWRKLTRTPQHWAKFLENAVQPTTPTASPVDAV